MTENRLHFAPVHPFDITVRYIDAVGSPNDEPGQHVHAECEIYINLGGDVSFMVEDRIYPIRYGSIVITRPYEYHHCIYHSQRRHPHFWILFPGEENREILKPFFDRPKGRGNLLTLGSRETADLIAVCRALGGKRDGVERYLLFFRLLSLLEKATEPEQTDFFGNTELASIVQTIHRRFAENLSVSGLAAQAHISVSTMERWFRESMNLSPAAYIRKIRLSNAAKMLSDQATVTETAEKCGFSDASAFITAFRGSYGVTPLQFRKREAREAARLLCSP